MTTFLPETTLFLDFDGVLCDSLEECYQSSYLTLIDQPITDRMPPQAPLDGQYQETFRQCRPFIRSGEDYVVLHQLIQAGQTPRSQADFDAELQRLGPAALAAIKQRLYAVRDQLLAKQRGLWLSWNPLYPGIAKLLTAHVRRPKTVILSTKKAEFIREILLCNELDWPLTRTIYTGTRQKLAIIDEMTAGSPAVLIDDQIDHLNFSHPSCQCYLALWGYVTFDQVTATTPALSLEQALRWLQL